MKVECFGSLDALPTGCAPLFATEDDFFSSKVWYQAVIDAALPDDASACFVVCTENCQPLALFPMQLRRGGSCLESLTTCYSCLYRPLLRADLDAADLRRVGVAFGRHCRAWPTVRMDALPNDWPSLAPLLVGLREAAMVVLRFDHFRTCHLPVQGLSWDAYFATRPRPLQETIRRRTRKVRNEDCVFQLITGGNGLEAGIAAYEHVYATSWKKPEPFPEFNPTLMRRAASVGLLRLGLLHRAGVPIAAQFWLRTSMRGLLLKLAHDEAHKSLSPGTVLTAWMIQGLLERDGVAALDFGRGDDPYKELWTGRICQRIGLVLANPLHWRGAAALGSHMVGRVCKTLLGAGAVQSAKATPPRY